MANKRMFNLSIVDSDAFLDLPLSTQALYFHLNMRADDDGFIGNPKKISRTIGASEDDLKLLVLKRFVLVFENGVIVIKHWRMHNTIRKDRYQQTNYIEDLKHLYIKENGSYTFNKNHGIPFGNQLATNWQPPGNPDIDIGLDIGIDKDIKETTTNVVVKKNKKNSEEWFNAFWTAYPNKANKKKSKERFLKICTSEEIFNTIMDGMKKTVIAKANAEGTQYIPMASTWLNGERWNDEPYREPTKSKSNYGHTATMPEYMNTLNSCQEKQLASSESIAEVEQLMSSLQH